MTVHLSASMSYDVMILACMFLFTAVCLDLAYHKEKVQIRDIADVYKRQEWGDGADETEM